MTTISESAKRATGSAGAEVTRSFVEPATRRVSYLTVGDRAGAPTLLLIHGSGVSARYWINQLQGLGGLRVVAVDLPGHGESDPMLHVSVEEYGGLRPARSKVKANARSFRGSSAGFAALRHG